MAERPSLTVASKAYADFQRARGMAEGTVRGRTSAVKLAVSVIGDIQVESVTPRHMERVFQHYPWTAQTANTKLSIYKAFFGWCRARGFVSRDHDPLLGWRAQRVPDKQRTRIPVQSWPALFNACEGPHERLVLATGLYLFLRVSEMASLQVRHVDLQNALIEVWRPKTQERDVMPIAAELEPHLREHLRWMSERGFNEPEHYLLPRFTKSYEQVNGRFAPGVSGLDPSKPATHLHRFVQRPAERAGLSLQHGEGGHALRRSGARAYFDALLEDGYDGALRRVQTMLGHKNSLMTEVYLGLDLDRQTRNSDLAGKPMFPALAEVVQLRRADGVPT